MNRYKVIEHEGAFYAYDLLTQALIGDGFPTITGAALAVDELNGRIAVDGPRLAA